MELRTTFRIEPSAEKISYTDPVMFIGSCFSISMGELFEAGRMPVMINPSGTVYNPVSVARVLEGILGNKSLGPDRLYYYNGKWISFDHYTEFSSPSREEITEKICTRTREASEFLSRTRFLFITFGTARVYRWKESGDIVSNCHKIPPAFFSHELLEVSYISDLWNNLLSILMDHYPGLKVIFTISPVRHWKDGPHGNQLSKSVLFLAVEKLLEHPSAPGYFPAYELMMDDLRDYRFYDKDMLHLSETAVNYIWEAFSKCYFDKATIRLWNEVQKISKAMSHEIRASDRIEVRQFSENILAKITRLVEENPFLDLKTEMDYFLKLREG